MLEFALSRALSLTLPNSTTLPFRGTTTIYPRCLGGLLLWWLGEILARCYLSFSVDLRLGEIPLRV